MAYNREINGRPTDNDWNSYYQRSNREKAETLYYYLYDNNKMADVRDIVGFNDSQSVSNITRCNGFYVEGGTSFEQGRYNGGRRITKPLDQKYRNLDLSLDDFYDFIFEYPNGIDDYHILDEFMIERDKLNRGIPNTHQYLYSEKNNYSRDEHSYSKSTDSDKESSSSLTAEEGGFLGCGLLIVIILIIIFRHQIMNFAISLIPIAILILILAAAFKLVFGKKR